MLGAFVFAYLWPVLVGGDVLSPTTTLYGVPPWAAFRPQAALHYYNLLLTDFSTSYYPWDVLARRLIHSGTFPAWNPDALGGTPFFANLGVGWLGPFNLLLWALPLRYGLGLAAALKLWVAALGAYLLARELRLGLWPGLLAGVSFALCAFDLVWLSHGAQVSVAVWLPWLVLLAERIVRRGGRLEGVALAVVVAMALAGGHPGTQVHVLAGMLLYALLRSATVGGVAWRVRLRRLATIGAGTAVGGLCMAVVLVPGALATVGTMGAAVRRNGGSEALIGHVLPLSALRTALFPDWWGRPSEALLTGPANYNERTFYAGGIALLLAAVAVVSGGRWRRKAPLLPLLALGIAVPLHTPLLHDLVVHLPAFGRVQDQRLLLWFMFAVAMLAAFGLQTLIEAPRPQARTWAVVGAGALAGAVAIATLTIAPGDLARAVAHLGDRFAGETASAVALASVLRWLLLVAVLAAALLVLRLRPRRRAAVGAFVAFAAALDMLAFAHAYQPMGPPSLLFPPRTPAIAFLQRHEAEGRVAGVQGALMNDYATVYGLRDVRGHDAPQPSLRFLNLWRLVNPGQDMLQGLDVASISPTGLDVLGLLGTRWIVAEPNAELPPTMPRDVLSIAYRGADATVLDDHLAVPRAFVASRIDVAAGERGELLAVAQPGFDARREVVMPSSELADLPLAPGGGVARVTGEQDARVTLEARLARRGLVVLDDTWAPGWRVSVDGRAARALRADVVMRGVVVRAGRHVVVWSYEVPGLRAGALLSLVAALTLAGWAGVLLVRSVRARLERLRP